MGISTLTDRTDIVIYSCRSCKRTLRKSYLVTLRRYDNEHPEHYLRRTTVYYQFDGGPEQRFPMGVHYPLIECGCRDGAYLVGKQVKGRFSANHRCDKRCMYATGVDCECQCAGENHGIAHCQSAPLIFTSADTGLFAGTA